MSAQGMSPRWRSIGWAVFAFAVVALLLVATPRAIVVLGEWIGLRSESLPWYASRLLGFVAYWALAASVIYGLALSTGLLDRLSHRAVSLVLHQELSAIAIALTLLHGAALLLDNFVRTTLTQVLVPFSTSYRPEWIGVGQIAFYLMVVVYASFYARRRIGQRAWRLLHYTTLLAFAGATAHGLMAGTDSGTGWAFWTYAGSTVVVVFLLFYRICKSVIERKVRVA